MLPAMFSMTSSSVTHDEFEANKTWPELSFALYPAASRIITSARQGET
jgi:hypothetical protein